MSTSSSESDNNSESETSSNTTSDTSSDRTANTRSYSSENSHSHTSTDQSCNPPKLEIDLTKKINGEFEIMDLIGKGDHSKVYVVKDQRGRERAAKFVAEDDKPILEVETQVMDKREGKRYHGKAYWDFFGKHGNTYVLVMDLFGDTVWEYHDKYLGFELKTALMIGIQLTRRLQALHERGFIHRDISPDNFLVGKKGAGLGYIYLIDHSNAVKYKDELNRHKPKGRIPKLCEVDEFSSYHERLSRRTDLESLMYCLVFFLRSRLPWTRKTEYYGGVARVLCTPEHLCIGLPEELRLYCEHVRNLKFEDTPNYSKLIGYLRTALENAGEEEDNQFDWMES